MLLKRKQSFFEICTCNSMRCMKHLDFPPHSCIRPVRWCLVEGAGISRPQLTYELAHGAQSVAVYPFPTFRPPGTAGDRRTTAPYPIRSLSFSSAMTHTSFSSHAVVFSIYDVYWVHASRASRSPHTRRIHDQTFSTVVASRCSIVEMLLSRITY
jgi:hypothetical protein